MPTNNTNLANNLKKNILYPEESYAIIGSCFNVYNEKGAGFLEPVYQECLAIEFDHQKIPYVQEKELGLTYRSISLKKMYKVDFVCYDKIIIELKAVSSIIDEHRAQVINYLHAYNLQLGILVNFGQFPKLIYERFILTESGRIKRELFQ